MDRITEFVEQVGSRQPEFNYQRNTIYLRFCHADYHKGAALAELSRLINIPREEIFAAGDQRTVTRCGLYARIDCPLHRHLRRLTG